MTDADLQTIRLELESLRAQVEEERAARARDTIAPPEPAVFQPKAPDLPGFFTRRYGAGGFDKVIVSPGYTVDRAGRTAYVAKTFTFSAAGELYARYQLGVGWETASSHVVQQAASLPAHSASYILIPIASIGWNGTDSRISTLVLHHTGTLKEVELPTGIVAKWTGSSASIPAGWQLSDGTNGSKDLRDKFIVGAGTTYAVDDTGGATTHSHSVNETIPKQHKHPTVTVQSGTGVDVYGGADECDFIADGGLYCEDADPSDTHWTMTTNSASSLPPYFALCYIYKL